MIKITVEMVEDGGATSATIQRPMEEIDIHDLLGVFRDMALALSYHENSWNEAIKTAAAEIQEIKK